MSCQIGVVKHGDLEVLNLNRDEFFDVYRMFRPDATWEQYEAEWEMFGEAMAKMEVQ